MGLQYSVSEPRDIFGSATTSITLTNAFSGHVSVPFITAHFAEMTVYYEYTTGVGGAGSSFQLLFEGSPDKDVVMTPVIFYQENFDQLTTPSLMTLSAGTRTFTGAVAATTYRDYFYFPVNHSQMRISAKETKGVDAAAGTLKLRVLLSGL